MTSVMPRLDRTLRGGVQKLRMSNHVLKWAVAILVAFVVGYSTPHGLTQKTGPSPFSLSVVPAWSHEEPSGRGISMATESHDGFYVILTNLSKEAQSAFLPSNSWGYYTVSFEVQTEDGRKFAVFKKPTDFTKNIPSTFVIPPGESMVYPIRLDDQWDAVPALPIADETAIPITIRAVYQLDPTQESAAQKVWIGRMESSSYYFKFRHWLSRLPS